MTYTSDYTLHMGNADSLFKTLLPYHINVCASIFNDFFSFLHNIVIMLLYLFWCFPKIIICSHESIVFWGHLKVLNYYVMNLTRKQFIVKVILVVSLFTCL